MKKEIKIINKKAKFNFEFLEYFTAGIMLVGSEIKSIRNYDVNFLDSYCYIKDNEVFIKNLHISEFKQANINNHDPVRDRKLLLTKREIKKLIKRKENLTIVPVNLFINDKGLCKLTIAIAKGKKLYDKKNKIKEKDIEKEKMKQLKDFNI